MTAAKTWVAVAGTLAMTLTSVFADNVIGFGEVGTFVTVALEAVATIAGVYSKRNRPKL
jgi:hypothetical protein